MLNFLFLSLALNFGTCQSVSRNDLSGKWEVIKVTESGQDITSIQGTGASRWIRFNTDGTFESDGKPFGDMRGTYSLDEPSGRILLKRDGYDRSVSVWMVAYEGYDLVFNGAGRAAMYKVYLNSSF